MTKDLGKLVNVPLREAWENEARDFTPWLAEHLEALSDAVKIRLELIAAEQALPSTDDSFSADLFARNLNDDTNVLIENQLQGSDHNHLGQIMTYLAGLEAKTVIWIAKEFREAHLAAIKWLNENTTNNHHFFAVVVRVVKISDSPLAPLFEVTEGPNEWERQTRSNARDAKELSPLGKARKHFWTKFQEKFPDFKQDYEPGGHSNMWHYCANRNLVISYYLARNEVGLFLRGRQGLPIEDLEDLLVPNTVDLCERLGVDFRAKSEGHYLYDGLACDFKDESQFENVATWLHDRVVAYSKILDDIYV